MPQPKQKKPSSRRAQKRHEERAFDKSVTTIPQKLEANGIPPAFADLKFLPDGSLPVDKALEIPGSRRLASSTDQQPSVVVPFDGFVEYAGLHGEVPTDCSGAAQAIGAFVARCGLPPPPDFSFTLHFNPSARSISLPHGILFYVTFVPSETGGAEEDACREIYQNLAIGSKGCFAVWLPNTKEYMYLSADGNRELKTCKSLRSLAARCRGDILKHGDEDIDMETMSQRRLHSIGLVRKARTDPQWRRFGLLNTWAKLEVSRDGWREVERMEFTEK